MNAADDEISRSDGPPSPAPPSHSRETKKLASAPIAPHVGRYEVACALASGGFGTVHLARLRGAAGFAKWVALKLAHPELARDPDFRPLFLHEAQIAAALHHPNLCVPFDFGETADGGCYLAMEFLRGQAFTRVRRALAKRGSAIDRHAFVARIVAEAARGLHAAHETRTETGESIELVHRDVAPSNLFVRFDGHVQVLDFGIAKSTHASQRTRTGMFRGHLSTLSPEQLGSERLDRRVDVWGLGVVLWELVVGRELFRRNGDAATMHAVLNDPAPDLRTIDPECPAALALACAGCLERDRDRRTPTAGALADALEEFLRETRAPMATHDVGRAMRALFPNGEAEIDALLVRARAELDAKAPISEEPTKVLAPSHPISIAIDVGDLGASNLAMSRAAAVDSDRFAVSNTPASSSSTSGASRARRVVHWLAVLGAMVVVSGTVSGTLIAIVDDPPPTAVVTRAPTPAPSPSPTIVVTPPIVAAAAAPVAPAIERPAIERPAIERPAIERPAIERPAIERPAIERPAIERPAIERPERPAVDRPARRRPTGRGELWIATPGGIADIRVDGREHGESPLRLTLPAGAHTVALRFDDGHVRTRRVTIRPNAPTRITERAP